MRTDFGFQSEGLLRVATSLLDISIKAPFVCRKVVSFWKVNSGKVNSGKVFSDVW
jgi:hypothetical protein